MQGFRDEPKNLQRITARENGIGQQQSETTGGQRTSISTHRIRRRSRRCRYRKTIRLYSCHMVLVPCKTAKQESKRKFPSPLPKEKDKIERTHQTTPKEKHTD